MLKPRAFVIGHPIAHSRSPLLHNYWLKHYAIEGSYKALDIAPDAIAAFFASFRDEGWVGGNVTVPHKTAVLPYLDRIDETAEGLGAVNTIWWQDGGLIGGNTDVAGFLGNLDEIAPEWKKTTESALVLGAGGAARAAVYGLRSRGVEVDICNRTASKAELLAQHFGSGVRAHGFDEIPSLIGGTDLLVNTTSLGMVGHAPLQLDLEALKQSAIVCDIVYAPLQTDLMLSAAAQGNRVVGGLGMLLHQAVDGFEHWFKRRPEVTNELRAHLTEDILAKAARA